jgi:hypothetical protein
MTDGDQLKADGMAQAIRAVPTWAEQARVALTILARLGQDFTSEDLVDMVGLPRGKPETNRNNAVGAVFSGAARQGWIHEVGRRNARRPALHARRLTVWRGTNLGPPDDEPLPW